MRKPNDEITSLRHTGMSFSSFHKDTVTFLTRSEKPVSKERELAPKRHAD